MGFCRSSQHLDQPLEVDPARSSAAMEHLAKRSLCARVVIGEQAPGEVRVAHREERKVRARHLALTNSCPRDVPSGIIPLGLFPMRSHFGALTSATSPACCRIRLASTRLRSHVRMQRTLLCFVSLCSILNDCQLAEGGTQLESRRTHDCGGWQPLKP